MRLFLRVLYRLATWLSDFGALALIGIMLMITANVLYRPFGVIQGTYELIELTITVTAVLSIIIAEVAKRHVVVDMITGHFSKRLQKITEKTGSFLSIIYYGILGSAVLSIVPEKFALHESTDLNHFPITPFRVIWGVGFIFFCIVIVAGMIRRVDDTGGVSNEP
jgi:TRAP-type C4-dicarboxylate transport system permease small subunit